MDQGRSGILETYWVGANDEISPKSGESRDNTT